ncbi:uncharacterized protein BJX67DRAFT_141111 [Aspergillus lucknowensis]|uniref:Uncharacterized protein n=1 Tax=Aspergillus lucknowensis TaxID=176173 RepID=A0ABR4LPM7_9EURO
MGGCILAFSRSTTEESDGKRDARDPGVVPFSVPQFCRCLWTEASITIAHLEFSKGDLRFTVSDRSVACTPLSPSAFFYFFYFSFHFIFFFFFFTRRTRGRKDGPIHPNLPFTGAYSSDSSQAQPFYRDWIGWPTGCRRTGAGTIELVHCRASGENGNCAVDFGPAWLTF